MSFYRLIPILVNGMKYSEIDIILLKVSEGGIFPFKISFAFFVSLLSSEQLEVDTHHPSRVWGSFSQVVLKMNQMESLFVAFLTFLWSSAVNERSQHPSALISVLCLLEVYSTWMNENPQDTSGGGLSRKRSC